VIEQYLEWLRRRRGRGGSFLCEARLEASGIGARRKGGFLLIKGGPKAEGSIPRRRLIYDLVRQ